MTTEFKDMTSDLTREESEGRIDIRYQTAAGKHVIIELKKYDRKVTTFELLPQIERYKSALRKCLDKYFPEEQKPIDVICILGSKPDGTDDQTSRRLLRDVDARYITYDTLVDESLKSYEEYLKKEKEASALVAIIDRLDREFPELPLPNAQ